MCNCISHNKPEIGGNDPEAVLTIPSWNTQERRTVCVDACIVDHVKAVWDAKIWTLGSCCGHNGATLRSLIVDQADHAAAQSILNDRNADMRVLSWQLCDTPGDQPATYTQADLDSAVMAERERCAQVAWSETEDREWEHWGMDKNVVVAQTVAKAIAAAIRSGGTPDAKG